MSETRQLPGAAPLNARDYFAGLAMQAWVSTWTFVSREEIDPEMVDAAARLSYRIADAMLSVRGGSR